MPEQLRYGERRRREVERELDAWRLPTWQQRVMLRFCLARAEGWYPLLHALTPNVPDDRPDSVLIGPRGVRVVLLRTHTPDDETVRRAFQWTAELLANAYAPAGPLADTALRTVLIHPGDAAPTSRPPAELLRTTNADRALQHGEAVFTAADSHAVAHHLAGQTVDLIPLGQNQAAIPPQRTGSEQNSPAAAPVAPPEQVAEPAAHQPSRDWRVFLDPVQLGIVRHRYSGPASITGPPGTGKTVLALHRLAHHARRTSGQLLFVTGTVAAAGAAQERFRQLAPQVKHRVEFTHLHKWARDFVAHQDPTHGHESADVTKALCEQALKAAWNRPDLAAPLREFRPSSTYWHDEIDLVIKGRGIRDLEEYRRAARNDPGHPPAALREPTWRFYQQYERELAKRRTQDHNDVLHRALAALQRQPLSTPYVMTVVDDVQDLPLLGLRLIHAISGDGPNQLLLLGDGQQQAHSGGWCLSDAGIPLRGRRDTLQRNYRNRDAIAAHAQGLTARNRFDDVHTAPAAATPSAVALRTDGHVVEWSGSAKQQPAALRTALHGLTAQLPATHAPAWDGSAVLTRSQNAAKRWIAWLRDAGFTVARAHMWPGEHPSPRLYVDTVHQAAHAEFPAVFLPGEHSTQRGPRRAEEHEREQRLELLARTRAREVLWLGALVDEKLSP